MNIGDKVYSMKDGKRYKVRKITTIPVGDRNVMVAVMTTGRTFYYDELMVLKRKSDGFFGWLFGR